MTDCETDVQAGRRRFHPDPDDEKVPLCLGDLILTVTEDPPKGAQLTVRFRWLVTVSGVNDPPNSASSDPGLLVSVTKHLPIEKKGHRPQHRRVTRPPDVKPRRSGPAALYAISN